MKSTEAFKKVIQDHLEARAKSDELFAVTFAKEGKNIDDCCTYILNQVQKSGCNGFADDEIFGMAIHYYDEDQIEVGKPINSRVVVNHSIPAESPINHEPKAAAIPKPAAIPKRKQEKQPSPYAQNSLFS